MWVFRLVAAAILMLAATVIWGLADLVGPLALRLYATSLALWNKADELSEE